LVDLVQRQQPVGVVRNDEMTLGELILQQPTALLISPGPGTPAHSRLSVEAVRYYWDKIPILGICLGLQILGEISGAKIIEAAKPMHGKTSLIHHSQKQIFEGMPMPFVAMRYHSLIIQEETLPATFEIIARAESREIMGIQHRELPLWGVQFHPESILTQEGEKMIQNWLAYIQVRSARQ
jgi:anthranilate synthase/aminodeoxychorismate synthase-like glutamine amidotransferase